MDLEAAWYEDDSWRGYLLTAPVHSLRDLHVLVTMVAGVEHHPDSEHPSFAPGLPVVLVADPDNPHDPAAIGIWDPEGTLQAGFIPHFIVRDLPTAVRHGVMMWEQLAGGSRVGLGIMLSREPVTVSLVEIPLAEAVSLVRKLPHAQHHAPEANFDPMIQMEKAARELGWRGEESS